MSEHEPVDPTVRRPADGVPDLNKPIPPAPQQDPAAPPYAPETIKASSYGMVPPPQETPPPGYPAPPSTGGAYPYAQGQYPAGSGEYQAPGQYPAGSGEYQAPGQYPPGYQAPGQYPSGGQYPQAGQPPGYPAATPYYAAGPRRQTNGMAIAALISSLILPPLGIVFGHIGLSQIKQRHEDGKGMAVAGLVIGYVYTGIALVAIVALGIVGVAVSNEIDDLASATTTTRTTSSWTTTSRAPRTTTTAPPTSTSLSSAAETSRIIKEAKVGDCIHREQGADLGNGISETTVTKATCGTSASTHKVVQVTSDKDVCGNRDWVRTGSESNGWTVLCLQKD
ncbi:DUF4190 domain-containing protein [Nocardia thailandica]|uniref:DUF4190 domain-containing protein n=1 Tax=Nocardia thailandica TaxID=257275 RepID=UPI0002E5FBB1|nr:DUF4190 domain-containing protein [Nocardia thailandica]